MVDSESTDSTVEIARAHLEKSDFLGHKIIDKKGNVPEKRNICVENMKGDMLLFWDSDEIISKNAMENLAQLILENRGDIISAKVESTNFNSIKEWEMRKEDINADSMPDVNLIEEIPATGMGNTLISAKVFEKVRFEPNMIVAEDFDFSLRARKEGFKIISHGGIRAIDINIWNKLGSDIFVDLPIVGYLKCLRKRAKLVILAKGFKITLKTIINHFLAEKYSVIYMSYIPLAILTVLGLLWKSPIFFALPLYLLLLSSVQIKKRGLKRGLRALCVGIVVGLPYSILQIFYCIKFLSKDTTEILRKDL